MSLILANSEGIDCKTFSGLAGRGFLENEIRIGNNYINVKDFNELVVYYLTNTDLEQDDDRLKLIDRIKGLKIIDGFNALNKRLVLS